MDRATAMAQETAEVKLRNDNLAFVCVTTRNYLHRTRVLFDSVTQHLPEAKRIALCADPVAGVLDPSKEAFEIVEAARLEIPRFPQWALALNPTALCCALKPHVIKFALKDVGIERVIYIDNDVHLYRKPTELLEKLNERSVVLTPHHLKPLKGGTRPDEAELRCGGIFNAGLIGFRKCAEAEQFVDWWANWLLDPRHVKVDWCYDQGWLDYVPVYCPTSHVLMSKGYNVAFWNLRERSLHRSEDGPMFCGDEPLTAYHYSYYSDQSVNGEFLATPFSDCPATAETRALYRDIQTKWQHARLGMPENLDYGFRCWSDGTVVEQTDRDALAEMWDVIEPDADVWRVGFKKRLGELYRAYRLSAVQRSPSKLRQWSQRLADVSPRKLARRLLRVRGKA
jgi:hypothetical protein